MLKGILYRQIKNMRNKGICSCYKWLLLSMCSTCFLLSTVLAIEIPDSVSLDFIFSNYATLFDNEYVNFSSGSNENYDPEVHMNATQLITSKGYPCENHDVVTKDGFILGLQRIPHGLNGTKNDKKKPVVFLQHGLLCSSTNWITNLKNESFAFILADAGFDVWLGNIRGNTYSRRHIKYSPLDRIFWRWSWDQIAEYDVPAMIDYALNKTRQPSLYYVGHSQGTLMMFAHLSENQAFASKIKTFFALGPVATVEYIESPLRIFTQITREIQDLFNLFGPGEFLPNNAFIKFLGHTICKTFTRIICENILFVIAGFDQQQLNATRLPVYLSHTPAGTSVENMVHFAQMVKTGQFQKFDYGSAAENMKHYNQSTAPLYHASKVTAPVALFSAQHDILADPWDVFRLSTQLPNVVHNEEIANWDHLDFIWAMDAGQLLYPKIITMIRETELKPKQRLNPRRKKRLWS